MARALLVTDQEPAALATPVPTAVAPSNSVIVAFASDVPANVGVATLVTLSVLEAPLSGSGLFPTGPQYFEFEGVDDVTGQHWYRVANVNFQ